MVTATKTLVTAAEFEKLRFPELAELVRGEVVEMTNPGPDHGQVCSNISELLHAWSPRLSKGRVLSNDSRVLTGRSPDTVRGPDVLFISKQRLPKQGLTNRSLSVSPDLVAEVFSPSDRWREVHDKVNDYLSAGVREVWVAHMKHRRVHVFRPDEAPTIFAADAELTTDVLPGFRCRVSEIFAGL